MPSARRKKTCALSIAVVETKLIKGKVVQHVWYNQQKYRVGIHRNLQNLNAAKARALHEKIVSFEIEKYLDNKSFEVRRKDLKYAHPFWQTKLNVDCARRLHFS
jgi:ABC-type transport system involved in Fe-S cluster assembly fused permease/ATPase subunit